MILLDPDLDPLPSTPPKAAKKTTAPKAAAKIPNQKIPTTRTLARFLALAQAAVRLRGQVTVLLTTDAAVKDLNKRFRGKNKATDVLSFPAEAMPGFKTTEAVAGDLAISVDTARKQGTSYGHSLGTELKVLILHGLLHLAGFDHEVDEGQMARRERALRAKLGLPLGLIERTLDARVGKGYGPPAHSPDSKKQVLRLPAVAQDDRMDGARGVLAKKRTTADPSTSLRSAQDDKKTIGGRA